MAFGIYQRVEWTELALFGPDGAPLAVSTPRTDWMRAAAIIPHRPLLRGQTYTARAVAQVDGKEVTKQWQFSTRRNSSVSPRSWLAVPSRRRL